MPFQVLLAFVLPLVSYFLIGLPSDAGIFLFFVLTCFVIFVVAQTFVQFISVVRLAQFLDHVVPVFDSLVYTFDHD